MLKKCIGMINGALNDFKHVDHSVGIECVAAVHRRHHHVDPTHVIKLLLRQRVMQVPQMGDAESRNFKDENRIAVALGAPVPLANVGRHIGDAYLVATQMS